MAFKLNSGGLVTVVAIFSIIWDRTFSNCAIQPDRARFSEAWTFQSSTVHKSMFSFWRLSAFILLLTPERSSLHSTSLALTTIFWYTYCKKLEKLLETSRAVLCAAGRSRSGGMTGSSTFYLVLNGVDWAILDSILSSVSVTGYCLVTKKRERLGPKTRLSYYRQTL